MRTLAWLSFGAAFLFLASPLKLAWLSPAFGWLLPFLVWLAIIALGAWLNRADTNDD